jgi:hypothetical protein
MTRGDVRVSIALVILAVLAMPATAPCWGPEGHAIVARAALAACDGLPVWFVGASDALADLANGPDRWREAEEAVPALVARRPDHFFDLDVWGRAPLPEERWRYVAEAERRGLRPEAIGFLPFAILEEYGTLLSAFRDARSGRPGAQAAALAAAGILAHLVGDAAVPLHTTRHHHGWVGPNPQGFTRAGAVHHWFEGDLVERVDGAGIRATAEGRHAIRDVPRAVADALADSLAQVPRLYETERRARQEHDDGPAVRLVRERLAAGATLLARLWRTAWVRSAS